MFGISISHILLVFILLLLFGPSRLPVLGKYLAKAVRNFKEQKEGILEAQYKNLGLSDEEIPPAKGKKA